MAPMQPNPLSKLKQTQHTSAQTVPQKKQKKSMNKLVLLLLFILTVLVFTAIGAGGYYLFNSDINNNNLASQEEPDQEQTEADHIDQEIKDDEDTIENKGTEPKIQLKECYNADLNVTSSIPINWECATDPTYTNIIGDIFTITISDLGRGPYCGDGPDPENKCTTKDYYEDKNVVLTAFYFEEELKELFGGIKEHTSWISIKYKNMETKELNNNQEDTLMSFLESIR